MKPETKLTVTEAVQGGLGLLFQNELTNREVLLTFVSDSPNAYVTQMDRKGKTQSSSTVPLEAVCLSINIGWVESKE